MTRVKFEKQIERVRIRKFGGGKCEISRPNKGINMGYCYAAVDSNCPKSIRNGIEYLNGTESEIEKVLAFFNYTYAAGKKPVDS